MQAWVSQARETIVRMTGLSGLTALDFTDDRLTTLLKRLSKAETWQLIEQQVDGGAVPRRGQLLQLRPSCAAGSSHPARLLPTHRMAGHRPGRVPAHANRAYAHQLPDSSKEQVDGRAVESQRSD